MVDAVVFLETYPKKDRSAQRDASQADIGSPQSIPGRNSARRLITSPATTKVPSPV